MSQGTPLLVNLRSNSKDALKCKICKKSFDTDTALKVHCVLHTLENTPDTFQCDKCSKSFDKEQKLKKHVKSHASTNILHCKICKETFEDSSTHQEHIVKIHTRNLRSREPKRIKRIKENNTEILKQVRESRYRSTKNSKKSTEKLKKKFSRSRKRVVIGNCKFACPFLHCQRKCSSNSQLIIHLTSHSTDRPLVCAVCGKGFKVKGAFDAHMKTHDKSRPKYFCHLCPDNFLWLSSYRKHLIKRHKIKSSRRFEKKALFYPKPPELIS